MLSFQFTKAIGAVRILKILRILTKELVMNYKQQNYAVKIFKLMSNHNRLKMLDYIAQNKGKLTVNEIAKEFEIDDKTVSGYLIKLKDNGLLKASQSGTNMYYSIKDERVVAVIELVKKLA